MRNKARAKKRKETLEEMENRIDIEEAKKALKEQGDRPFMPWVKAKKKLGLKK